MAGDRNLGVFLCRRRFGLLLLATAAAGLCIGVSGVKNPSCHEVRTAFQLRQIGPIYLVPDVPTADSNLQICQHRSQTCCTKKMEESYQAAVRRERKESIQTLNFELKYMIVGHMTAFQAAFESLLRFAENHTTSLFETVYRPMSKEATEPVKELFTDISLYLLGAQTTVESIFFRFFDSLFPLVYSRLINPGITGLSEEYMECLRLTRQDINPFGLCSKEAVTKLEKALWANRIFSQALGIGTEVLNATEHATLTKECSRALVKMQYCPHCQGLTLIRPCEGYCLNVMRGCFASISELDAQWKEYIYTLEYLTNEMTGSHDLEWALLGIRNSINDAILHAQLNGPHLSATVDKVCGQPEEKEVKPLPDNIVQAKEITETQSFTTAHSTALSHKRSSLPLKASKNDKSRSLKKMAREFINYMKRSRTLYASLTERLCDGDLVMKDSSTCWNGEGVVESYTSRVVTNGLKAQIDNPELKVRGMDPHISNLIAKLQQFNQLYKSPLALREVKGATEKRDFNSERLAIWEGGSGNGMNEEMESSGDCDDEDGCQGSGARSFPKDVLIAILEDGNETSPTVRKMDTATTATIKTSPKHKADRDMGNRASSSLLFIITAFAVLWHSLL
ncbi:glypican-5-like isoform X3 [Rhineura floridana]|uniref:glypican-5-like isoform X3 n=1 Tax=Rhineura floridana TaxID=261503 RepID=UPI002AC89042|nr:glypican-5-like isoform X3 [Rhineura floridana]